MRSNLPEVKMDKPVMYRADVEVRFGVVLLPCPFCAHSALVGLWLGPNPHVTCAHCMADGPIARPLKDVDYGRPSDHENRQLRACRLWNNRPAIG